MTLTVISIPCQHALERVRALWPTVQTRRAAIAWAIIATAWLLPIKAEAQRERVRTQGTANAANAANAANTAMAAAPTNGPLDGLVSVRQLPPSVRQQLDLGREALAAGRHDDALKAFEEALKQEPSNPYGLSGRAMALHKLERNDQARQAYLQALAGGGDAFASQINLAALTARQDPVGAVEQMRKALQRKHAGAAQDAVAGYVFAEAGDLSAAAERFRQALRTMPGHPALVLNYAVVLDHLGRGKEAIDAYRQALSLPDQGGLSAAQRQEVRARLVHLERAPTALALVDAGSTPAGSKEAP